MTATHGEGVYGDAVGVTTPLDHKMAQLGHVIKTAANTIRPGLFWDGNATVVSGKANMSYDVRAFACVMSRGATAGAVFLTNDAVYNVATTAAPGSNSRYDVVYIWQREYSLDGTNSDPVIGVVQGTAAASPTVPSLSAFPGAIELARILVPSGVTATNSGTTITQTSPFTATAGGTVVLRNTTERDAGSWVDGTLIYLIDTGLLQKRHSSAWSNVDDPPTTLAVSGSNTTLDATKGVVTFTAATSPVIQIVNASSWRWVDFDFEVQGSAAADLQANLRSGLAGSDLTTGTYLYNQITQTIAGSPTRDSSSTATFWKVGNIDSTRSIVRIRLYNLGVAQPKLYFLDSFGGAGFTVQGGGRQASTTIYDTVHFTASGGASITGTCTVSVGGPI